VARVSVVQTTTPVVSHIRMRYRSACGTLVQRRESERSARFTGETMAGAVVVVMAASRRGPDASCISSVLMPDRSGPSRTIAAAAAAARPIGIVNGLRDSRCRVSRRAACSASISDFTAASSVSRITAARRVRQCTQSATCALSLATFESGCSAPSASAAIASSSRQSLEGERTGIEWSIAADSRASRTRRRHASQVSRCRETTAPRAPS